MDADTKFAHGLLLFTKGFHALMLDENDYKKISHFIIRHTTGDFGDLCPEDVDLNNREIQRKCGRVLSVYVFKGVKIWIVTDGIFTPEVVTTVLLPEEY